MFMDCSTNNQWPIYLDYNATTPVDPRVLEKIYSVLRHEYGNPSSRHVIGARASSIVEEARFQTGKLVGCSPSEIIFTSGATESCNMAIRGIAEMYKERGRQIITSATEHKAVLSACGQLVNDGFEVTRLRPDKSGVIDPQSVQDAITNHTILVCVMMANNVTGVINPVAEIAQLCRKRGVIFFCDGTQAIGKIPVDVEALGLDAAAFSSHKMYGAKGTGALYLRSKGPRVRMRPLLPGGQQERGLRAGTENVAGIAGMGKACECCDQVEQEAGRCAMLTNRLEDKIRARIPGAAIIAGAALRLPNTTNISFAGVRAENLLRQVPEIAASAGAACDSTGDSTYVLKAIGVEEDIAAGAVRFSVGRFTTAEQIDAAVELIADKLRES